MCVCQCVCVFVHAVVAVAELLLSWVFTECGCGRIDNQAGPVSITAMAAAIEAGHCNELQGLDIRGE